jgi:hypothetical protein
MANYNIDIKSSGDPDPNPQDCNAGDTITWTNNYRIEIRSFTLPASVSPQTSPAPIAAGATTAQYTINSGSNGSYDYEYRFASPAVSDPRGGTIDVG